MNPVKTHYDILTGGINIGSILQVKRNCDCSHNDRHNQFMALLSRHVEAPLRSWNKGDPIFHIAESGNIVASLYDAGAHEVDHKDDNYP